VTDRRAYDYWTDDYPGIADFDPVIAFDVDEMLPWMQFVFAGGENTQDYGGTTGFTFPFSISTPTGFAPLRTQNLYLASDINGSGPITGIAFQNYQFPTLGGTFTFTMTLSHATVTMLSDTFANNYAGTKTTVASSVTFTVPAGIPGGDWFWVPIPSGTFTYNGTANLIVEVVTEAGTGQDVYLMGTSRPGQRMWALGAATAAGVVDDAALHIKLRFNGGTMDVLTPNGMSGGVTDVMPFYGPAGKSQYLYLASELGTKGTISKIACRNTNSVDAVVSGMTLTVEMGHTLATALSATYASNFTSPVVVFSGPISTPAVMQGDWLNITLKTPFAYNGIDNLVVQMAGTGPGSSAPLCVIDDASAAQYPSRRVFDTDPTATLGTVTDRLMDMRFMFQ
jgi:hypothetical protein